MIALKNLVVCGDFGHGIYSVSAYGHGVSGTVQGLRWAAAPTGHGLTGFPLSKGITGSKRTHQRGTECPTVKHTERGNDMTIKEFASGFPAEKEKQIIAEMVKTADIWNNQACMGYCIKAARMTGIPEEQISIMVTALDILMNGADSMSVEEAQQIFRESYY